MLSSLALAVILLVVFTTHLVKRAASEVYIDASKALKRDTRKGVVYANFAVHKFRSLNLAPLVSNLVKEPLDCGFLCVHHSSCFSTNLAAVPDQHGRIICELLPSDKYNNSNKFLESAAYHHLSIKVRKYVFINIHTYHLQFGKKLIKEII